LWQIHQSDDEINIIFISNLVGEDEITNLLPHAATQSPLVIRSHTTESKTKTNKGYEEHKLKLALQQSSSNSSKSSKNDSLKRPTSYNTVTGGTTSGSGLGSGAQVISSREFDQMRRNSQSIGESRWEYYSWTHCKTLLPNLKT